MLLSFAYQFLSLGPKSFALLHRNVIGECMHGDGVRVILKVRRILFSLKPGFSVYVDVFLFLFFCLQCDEFCVVVFFFIDT